MEKKIDILGTEYTVLLNVTVETDSSLENRMGYCQPTSRKIVVIDLNDLESWRDETVECKRKVLATTLRHEVLHAFMAESGLWSNTLEAGPWSMNEEMIDWFAMQWPKILEVFRKLGCDGICLEIREN